MTAPSVRLGGGIVTALLTPFERSGRVDYAALDALVDFQCDHGVHGLFVLGTSGEGLLLRAAERAAVAERVLGRSGGKVAVAVHCGAADTVTAVDLVRDAAAAGARTVAAIPPLFYDYGQGGIYAHFLRLAEAAPDRDHYLYDNPARVGYSIGAGVVQRLVTEVPCIRGVKDTDDSLARITGYLATIKDIQVFTGNNLLVLPSLVIGAVGAVSTTANAVPELFVALHDAYRDGNLPAARELQLTVARLHQAMAGLPYIAAAKHLTRLRGLPSGGPRGPLPDLTSDQRATLEGRLHRDDSLAPWLKPVG